MSDPRQSPIPLEERLEAAKKEILSQVHQETTDSLVAHERAMVADIKQAVGDAVDLKYKVVVAEFSGKPNDKHDSKSWQTFLVILPILLTGSLGAWISYKFDNQKQELVTRLALTQEYEKQKVAVYQDCAKDLSLLLQALQMLEINPRNRKEADDKIHDIYECALNHTLYVSDSVNQKLSNVRTEAIAVLQNTNGTGTVNTAGVEAAMSDSEAQMRKELVDTTATLDSSR